MVYEGFSHGVYSFYMIYAFLFLLGGGALPFLVVGLQKNSRSINPSAKALYHCGLATLTIGSILQGVLEIYGTTNTNRSAATPSTLSEGSITSPTPKRWNICSTVV